MRVHQKQFGQTLDGSSEPLASRHDLVMFDLDGVVYVGGEAVPGVPAAVERLRGAGVHVAFVTNNASRTAAKVAQRLVDLGVDARADDVVTSAQAAASLLRDEHGVGARIMVLGGPGLMGALEDAGLVPVADVEADDVVAMVSGYGPDVLWRHVMRAAVRVRDGLPWVASNDDLTIPTAYGQAPGHGMLVKTIADFAGVSPVVAGKPARPLLDETIERVGGARPLMVGDRLDTDIEGARVVGVDSLLVLTGVTGLAELVAARPQERPTYVSPTVAGLFERHPVPAPVAGDAGAGFELGGWRASVSARGELAVEGSGGAPDWWRVVAAAAWAYLDDTGTVVSTDAVVVPETHGPRAEVPSAP